MKGKLIKYNHFYALQIDNDIIAVSLDKETEEHTVNYKHQLSLKNCQAIENGYDLDELSSYWRWYYSDIVPEHLRDHLKNSYKAGFQAALEILGDKKFSEEDIETAFAYGQLNQLHNQKYFSGSKTYIQSLQQTEFDVEIVMDRIPADLAPDGWDVFPKLDAENCIILKRVE